MSDQIEIRSYKNSDAKFLSRIYYDTIHIINAKDYSLEQREAWAPTSCLELEGWERKWSRLPPLVAIIGEQIVGFAEFEPNGHIDSFYVHHQFQGRGVGSALMNVIEKQVIAQSLPKIFAEVSITAKPFFEAKGFVVVKEQTVLRHGVKLTNFVMEKRYNAVKIQGI